MREINEAGLRLIKMFEGCSLEAYLCPAKVWTIGYGHTKGVDEGDIITQAEADELLEEDLQDSQKSVDRLVKTQIDDNQFSALVSFVFNLGATNFKNSTLLKKVNVNNLEGAAEEFGKWVYAGGKRLQGLVNRRKAEKALFNSEGEWA